MRRAGLLAAFVAVALTAWLGLDRPGRAARAAREEPEPPAAEVAPGPAAPEAPSDPAPASGPVSVRGRVTLLGSDRVPGRVTGMLVPLEGEGSVEFEASDGGFDVEAPPGRYWATDVEVDGEEVDLLEEVVVGSGGEVELRIPEAREVTLVVVDAGDRKPVAGALVYEDRDPSWTVEFENGNRVPGPNTLGREPRRTDALGRLALGKGRGSAALYVHAEGRAWCAARVPFHAGGEVVIELEPGGDVRVLIPRFGELDSPQVWAKRLFTNDWIRLVPAEEILVRGLVADDYAFSARRGAWYEESREYGTVTATVRAGAEVTVTVPVTPDPPAVMVKVTGTVAVADGWREEPGWFDLEGLEQSNAEIERTVLFGQPTDEGFLRRLSGEGHSFRFEFANVPAGLYLVELRPYQWAREIAVTDRSAHFDLEVPRPVTVRVRVKDAQGRDLTPVADVSFHVPVERRRGWSPDRAEREGDALALQAPPGPLVIDAEAPGCIGGELRIDVRADREATISLERAGTVVVRLRIDGKPFDGAGVELRLDAPLGAWMTGFDGGVARLDKLPPGKWTASLKDVPGCEPLAPIDVEVAAGETREIAFDLKRKR